MSMTSSCRNAIGRRLDRGEHRAGRAASYSASDQRSSWTGRRCSRSIKSAQWPSALGSVVATAARALALAAISASLAACGQKGPLVLAKPAPPTASACRPRAANAFACSRCRPRLRRRADGPARRTRHRLSRRHALMVEGIAAADLARRFGTPLYVYSSAAMARALAPYQRALAGRDHLLCYAVKANSTLAVLQWFARRGCGFDIVSGGELERVLAAGGDPARIVFSGVGKTRAEMQRALAVDVRCFNVESVGELELLSEVASRAGRRARGQPARQPRRRSEDPSLHLDRPARQQVRHRPRGRAAPRSRAPRACRASRWSASTATSARRSSTPRPYVDALDRLLDLVERGRGRRHRRSRTSTSAAASASPIATRRRPTPTRWSRACSRASMRAATAHRKLMFEPGRSLIGNAGVLISEVLYLKPGERAQLLHRRRGDERPDAAGDVRRLDADRRVRAGAAAGRHVGRGRPGLRIGRLARPRPRARRRARRLRRRAVRRRLRHEHGEQLQHPPARRRGDGVGPRGVGSFASASRSPT